MAEPIDLDIPDDAEPTFDAGPAGVAAGLDAAQADPGFGRMPRPSLTPRRG
jgi:hypothetical protein